MEARSRETLAYWENRYQETLSKFLEGIE